MKGAALPALAMVAALCGCSREQRQLAADQPQTAPGGLADPRVAHYGENLYQIAQGSRYYTWYGCGTCHGSQDGARDLSDGSLRDVVSLYRAIAEGHPAALAFGRRVPSEQIWQMAAYLHDAARHQPSHNRRNALDQQGEPQGAQWQGPLW